MKQEYKDLLLKDLWARIPYGVKVKIKYYDESWKLLAIYTDGTTYVTRDIGNPIETYFEDSKPYLFPLSSMTDEQKYTCPIGVANLETFIKNESWTYLELTPDSILCLIDWLNKNHFDYRGLIEKGLAIDATGLNIY
jgi:hypothetical protein